MKLASAALAAGLVAAIVAPDPARAAIYGLVVGVDRYIGTAPLQGAVNDASDIAAVLRARGAARVELFTDEQARRETVVGAWESMLAEAGPGDTLIFSFAGHGTQEPDEHLPKDEPDGLDEVFLLQGFSESDDAAFGDKIYDDELNEWAAEAEARGIKVIFVFDTCHSGVPVRSIDPRVEAGEGEPYTGERFTRYNTRPTRPSAVDDPSQLATATFGENIVALGATDESLRVREQRVDGKPRGILSWAFARAVEGAADADGDSVIASDELALYIRRTVVDRARHRQIPQVSTPTRSVRLISVLPDGPGVDQGSPPDEPAQTTQGTPPVVAANGPASVEVPEVSVFAPADALGNLEAGINLAGDRASADYVWDQASGDLIDVDGDVLAFGLAPGEVDLALESQRLRRAIGNLVAAGNALDVRLTPGNNTHCTGEQIVIQGISKNYGHYTAFNVTGAGEIQYLWPSSRFNDPVAMQPGELWKFATEVGEPYGSDSVVLIATDGPLGNFHQMLEHTGDLLGPLEVWRHLESALKGVEFEIAVQDIFTREKAPGSQQCG